MTDRRDKVLKLEGEVRSLRPRLARAEALVVEQRAELLVGKLAGRMDMDLFERVIGVENVVDDDGRLDDVRLERQLEIFFAKLSKTGSTSVGGRV